MLCNKEYNLIVLVKHLGMHFTSAVYGNEHSYWIYIDDLQDRCVNHYSLEEMYFYHRTGWFFAVYKQESCIVSQTENINLENGVDFALESTCFSGNSCFPSSKGNKPTSNIQTSKTCYNDNDVSNSEGSNTEGYVITEHDSFAKPKYTSKPHQQVKRFADIFPEKKEFCIQKEINILGDLEIGQKRVYNKQNNIDKSDKQLERQWKICSENKRKKEFDTHENINIKELSKFHLALRRKMVECSICMEAWPHKGNPERS